jgi:hypothetical protein
MMFHKTIRLVSVALCCLLSTTVAVGKLVPVAKQSGADLCLKDMKIEGYRFKECQPEAGGTATWFIRANLPEQPTEWDESPILVYVTKDQETLFKRISWGVKAEQYFNNPIFPILAEDLLTSQ